MKGVCGDNSFEFPSEGKQRNGVVGEMWGQKRI